MSDNTSQLRDPFKLIRVLWPKIRLYDKQEDVLRSVFNNDKTICVAGNKLGKDFVAALIAIVFFLTRNPCRVVTTSVDSTQLESVLWGEIRNLIQTSVVPLTSDKGGPLLVNHMHIRKVFTSGPLQGQTCGKSYLIGRVAKKGEGFLGHHIARTNDKVPRTLFLCDESSGLEDTSLEKVETWADRQLYIGNAFECNNLFYRESEAGDKLDADNPDRFYTKVIRITGHDSPNVRYAKAYERVKGEKTGHQIIPGVLPYYEYKKWINTWDAIRISISIDAQFYKGSELLLFPPTWLDKAHAAHRLLKEKGTRRIAKAIGVDPGEGAAETAWSVVDEYGVIDMIAIQTPDTSDIAKRTVALMKRWNVPANMVMFDKGGGGLQIAQAMRDIGYPVRTVAFGESVSPLPKSGQTSVKHKIEQSEERYAYLNRRAEMFGHLSQLLDPSTNELPFAIPDSMVELRRQLALIPKKYDKEGRLYLPPKNKKDPHSKEKTLIEIIGCSPDRADATVIALHCRDYAIKRSTAGAA